MTNKHFKDPNQAFEDAIKEGRLSDNPKDENFAGNYMYMGPSENNLKDTFKNIDTRSYLP